MNRYKLGDICEIVSGSTPKTNIDEFWDGDIKWITPAELNDDSYIINDSVRKITDLAVKKNRAHFVSGGDSDFIFESTNWKSGDCWL